MRLDVLDLQLLVNVHHHGTLTAGAAATHLSRAAAGERLRALQARVGTPLLAHDQGRYVATEVGEALLRHARQVLAQVDAMAREMASHRGGAHGRLRVLCNTAAGREALPEALAGFLARHPDVAIGLEEHPSEAIVEALAAGEAELGVVSDAVERRGLREAVLRPDPLALVLPDGHRLARHGELELSDVLDEPFVGLAENSPLQSHVDGHARRLRNGERVRQRGDQEGGLDYRLRLDSLDAVCRLAAAGVGLAVVPRTAARRCVDMGTGLRAVPLREPWARRRLLVVARSFRALSPAARGLAAHLRATAAALA